MECVKESSPGKKEEKKKKISFQKPQNKYYLLKTKFEFGMEDFTKKPF